MFFRADGENKMATMASDWLWHFWLLLWNRLIEFNETWQAARYQLLRLSTSLKLLNGIQQNLTGSMISMSSTKFAFFWQVGKTRWLPWPLIGWDIFHFYSETVERNSTKLDRKEDLNILYQVCVFQVDHKNKMALYKGGTLYSGARYVIMWPFGPLVVSHVLKLLGDVNLCSIMVDYSLLLCRLSHQGMRWFSSELRPSGLCHFRLPWFSCVDSVTEPQRDYGILPVRCATCFILFWCFALSYFKFCLLMFIGDIQCTPFRGVDMYSHAHVYTCLHALCLYWVNLPISRPGNLTLHGKQRT